MLQEGLFGEELIVKRVLAVVYLVSLQLERVWREGSAPSSASREITFLVYDTVILGRDIFKVNGAVPVHVGVVLA